MHKDLVEPTTAFLAKYIVFSKAELKDMSDDFQCYGITGSSLTESEIEIPQAAGEIADIELGHLLKVSTDRFEIWSKTNLEANNDPASWLAAELSEGVIWVDAVTAEEFIPQMFNLHNIDGISFEKGCYLGQEIVARMQYRGELKNRLHLAELETGSAPEVGAKIQNGEGKKLGEVVATAGSLVGMVLKAGEPTYTLENGTQISPTEVAEAPA